jgi:hypothetical protein
MFDRDTMMIVAMIVTLAGTIYMFREFQKQKQEITNVKYYVSKKLSTSPSPPSPPKKEEEEEEDADSDDD